mmetsp:Transcript_98007/g.174502  ORF Transcript_98007/g.174502 Transcript_98007/m.174502 type:complete len:361 (+) Transcript_98007:29-1111(+)
MSAVLRSTLALLVIGSAKGFSGPMQRTSRVQGHLRQSAASKASTGRGQGTGSSWSLVCLALAAGLQARKQARGGRVSRKEAITMPSSGLSAVVFGWFGATPRELELVQRMYKKNGYQEVSVVQSPIKQMTSPRGWCSAVKAHSQLGAAHPLARNVDVVHCLSGGFLNFYLLRAAGIPLSCSSLLLDSTPILPKPKAFATFSRQYMADAGKGGVARWLPLRVCAGMIHSRWVLSGCIFLLQERLRVWREALLGNTEKGSALVLHWTRFIGHSAVMGAHHRVVKHMMSTIFKSSHSPDKVIFLHNPEDPYLDASDVVSTMATVGSIGPGVTQRLVSTGHVQTLFRKPKEVFSAFASPCTVDS